MASSNNAEFTQELNTLKEEYESSILKYRNVIAKITSARETTVSQDEIEDSTKEWAGKTTAHLQRSQDVTKKASNMTLLLTVSKSSMENTSLS